MKYTLFTEYSKLENYGEGASIGLAGSLFEIITYKMEYRQLGENLRQDILTVLPIYKL